MPTFEAGKFDGNELSTVIADIQNNKIKLDEIPFRKEIRNAADNNLKKLKIWSMSDVNFIEINEGDLETIRKWRNSSEVGKYMYTDNVISSDQQKNWFEKISLEENSRYWMIEYQGKKLGLVYIIDIDTYNSKCYWGFYLGDTSIRGEGIGKK